MPNGQISIAFGDLRTLFNVGATGALTDRELLDQFQRREGEGAELAFTALIERHGPMVFRVCRSILADSNDADDAFQATFLVLVRRAGSLRVHDSLGPWLHQVAHRTALCARSAAARRQQHERLALVRSSHDADSAVDAHELGEILHAEVIRLPDRYRVVIVHCLLEGLTHDQAARHLGWPAGTVQSRLARGKALLRDRLTRRGLTPGALALGGLLATDSAAATLPFRLVGTTIRAVTLRSTGGAAIPSSTSGLANKVINAMFIIKLKSVLTAVLLAGFMLGAGVYAAMQASGAAPSESKDTAQAHRPGAARSGLVAPREMKGRAGRGTLLLFALDRNGQRIDRLGNGIYEETTVEARWVVITGVLDHAAVCGHLRQDRGEDAIDVHPSYLRTEVESQTRTPGAAWSAWSRVDRETNDRILKNAPEAERESTPESVRIDTLVDLLPFLKAGAWEGVDVDRLLRRPEAVSRVQGGVRRGGGLPFPTTDAPEVMIRSLDFTVEPGFHYRYRVRIVIDGSDGVGQRREVFGRWSEPTAEVAVLK